MTGSPFAQTMSAGSPKPGSLSAARRNRSLPAKTARSMRTVLRRMLRWDWFQAVAASPRLVSHPNAFGSGRSGRTRIC